MRAQANDGLIVSDTVRGRPPEHQKLSDKCCELQKKLEKKLDENAKLLLTKLVNAICDEEYQEAVSSFDRGYRLGVLTTMEVFEHYNSFSGREGKIEHHRGTVQRDISPD